jgi:hypothetical protein
VVLCRDVASVTVNQLDRCNLLRRSIVCSGTGKTSYWSVLRMNYLSAFCPVQIFVAAQRDTARHLIEQAVSNSPVRLAQSYQHR